MRRFTLVILLTLVLAPTAQGASHLSAEKARSRAVLEQVRVINTHLDAVVEQWDGARVQLSMLHDSLLANERELRIAHGNLTAAQRQLEQRLYDIYVDPPPGSLELFLGATSLSNLIDQTQAMHAVSQQDIAIADQARHLKNTVARREAVLRRERRQEERTAARLAAQRASISDQLSRERRLLASIHESIQRLTAEAAAAARRQAAAERARIEQRVLAARAQAASAAIAQVQPPVVTDPGSTTTTTPDATPPDAHPQAAAIAAQYLGVPYVWGGESPAGFDCSGLVSYVYAQLGISLPHYTVSQWDATLPIDTSDLEPGDLVFFDGLSHVGIYIGGNEFIDAPHTGAVVEVDTLSGYWAANLDGARRVP